MLICLEVSPVDLSYFTRKLGVKFNDRALLGTVDVSTPLPDVIGWVSRMVLASCG